MAFFGNEIDPLFEDIHFKNADSSERGMWFAHTDDPACAKEFNVKSP